jgi:hypothetical protein
MKSDGMYPGFLSIFGRKKLCFYKCVRSFLKYITNAAKIRQCRLSLFKQGFNSIDTIPFLPIPVLRECIKTGLVNFSQSYKS